MDFSSLVGCYRGFRLTIWHLKHADFSCRCSVQQPFTKWLIDHVRHFERTKFRRCTLPRRTALKTRTGAAVLRSPSSCLAENNSRRAVQKISGPLICMRSAATHWRFIKRSVIGSYFWIPGVRRRCCQPAGSERILFKKQGRAFWVTTSPRHLVFLSVRNCIFTASSGRFLVFRMRPRRGVLLFRALFRNYMRETQLLGIPRWALKLLQTVAFVYFCNFVYRCFERKHASGTLLYNHLLTFF